MNSYFRIRTECPACMHKESTELFARPYDSGPVYEHLRTYYSEKGVFEPHYIAGGTYRILECRACGLMYQQQIPNAEFLGRLYGAWVNPQAAYERNRKNLGGNVAQYLFEMWQLRYWGKGKQLKVLDYGMGWGRWCEVAYTFGHDVHGYEYESERQDRDRLMGVKVLGYDELPGQQFDFINTEQVFEHLTDPLVILRHLIASLRSGGMLRISVPAGTFVKRNLARFERTGEPLVFEKGIVSGLTNIEPLQHLNCWDGPALQRFGFGAGLKRYQFPLRQRIAAKQDWLFPRGFFRNILQPISARYRHDDGTMLYFVKP
jgi:SAM-dependent methyltransferase